MPPRKKATKPMVKEMLYRVIMQPSDVKMGDTPESGHYGGSVVSSVMAISKKDAVIKSLQLLEIDMRLQTFFRRQNAFPDIFHVELALHSSSINTFVDQYEKDYPEVFAEEVTE